MAATFINLSFETQGVSPGLALGWDVAFQASFIKFAAYGSFPPRPDEGYNVGWNNDNFVTGFLNNPLLVERAIYGTFTEIDDVEKYETDWNNSDFSFALGLVEDASYDAGTPESVEDYEEEWDSNENFSFVLGATDDADYDIAVPEPFEDYEEEWDNNQNRVLRLARFQAPNEVTFIDSNPDTITRITGSWTLDGFVAGMDIEVRNSISNDGFFTIDPGAGSVSALLFTLIGSDTLTPQVPSALSIEIKNYERALYDGGALVDEGYEGVWTPL